MTDFTPENPLEVALLAASQGEDAEEFLDRLARDELFVPAQGETPAGGERELEAGQQVALPVFEHEGRRFVPVFTSLTQLERGAPHADRYLRASGADLASVWPSGHDLALNPGGDLGVALPEDDVRTLSPEQRIPAGSELTVGAPAEEPEELWERLRAWATAHPEVRAAHRALVLLAGETEPQLVVGLELEPTADHGRVLKAGAEALEGGAAFTLVDPEAEDDPLSGWMLRHAQPLYTRPHDLS